MQTTTLFFAILALATTALAHMEMQYPPPLRSKYNPLALANAAGTVDYSMTSPLSGAAQFPCKGYQSDLSTPAGGSVATWNSGGAYNFTIVGGAVHGGGSCQAALSYDGGKSMTVITSYIGSCPLTSGESFPVTIPSDAPTGSALFVWTWYNQIGNREIYQNCAHITIGGAASKKRASSTAFTDRPGLFVANLANGCTTVETKDVVFPDPGPDVVSKSTVADDSGSFVGTCAAVNGIGGGSSGASSGSGSSAAPSAAGTSAAPATSATVVSPSTLATSVISTPGGVFVTATASQAPSEASATTTASATAITIIPVDSTPSASSPAASATPASTGTGSTGSTGSQSGACTQEGMFNCIGGTEFQQCASGAWSVVMPVASGTKCTAGQSMSLDIGFATKPRRSMRRHIARTFQ